MAAASLQSSRIRCALLARGRIQLAQKRNVDAAETLARAARVNPLPEYQWTLADALRLLNRIDEAAAIEKQLVRDGVSGDPRTLALYLSTRRADGAQAVHLARREMENRSDVFTLDALAWALASAGRVDEASTLMSRALAEGTEDGRLFLHAAVIAAADGRPPTLRAGHARPNDSHATSSELGVLGRESCHHPMHEVIDMKTPDACCS